jgi:hypothetical protein
MRIRGFIGDTLDLCRLDASGGVLGGPVPYFRSQPPSSVGEFQNAVVLGYNTDGAAGVGYGQVLVRGAAGFGQVYDEVNNPVVPLGLSGEALLQSGDPGVAPIISTPYTAPWTGYYQVGFSLACGNGAAWGAGQFASFAINVNASLYPNGRSTWTQPWSPAAGSPEDDRWHPVFLTAGQVVTVVDNSNAALNMGAGGGYAAYIQPLVRTA